MVAPKTTLVTGATGFLGRALVERLSAQGDVRVVGRRPMPRWRFNTHIEHLRADITDQDVIEKAVEGVHTVYHLAAATGGSWETFRAATIEASRRLLEVLDAAGGARVVFVSSLGNYDGGAMAPGMTIDEDFPLERASAGRGYYALAKTRAELTVHPYLSHSNVILTIVRPGIVYGLGMKNPLTGVAIALKGRVWIMFGSGDKPVPLVHLDDVSDGLVEIAADERTIGRIYNLVHPEQPSQNEYLQVYRQLSGDRRKLMRLPVQRLDWALRMVDFFNRNIRGQDSQYAYAARRMVCEVRYSGERLLQEIGFAPRIAYKDGLRRLFQNQNR
jgi:nucleoside-diphosphate-sugar epimerase